MAQVVEGHAHKARAPGRHAVAVVAALGAVLFALPHASAGACDLPDEEVRARLGRIERDLSLGKPGANLWWGGWLGVNLGLTVVFGAKAGLDTTRGDMVNDAVSAAQSAVGVLGLAIDPMVPGYAPDRLRELPDGTAKERCRKLDRAEQLLLASARREIDGRGWLNHVLGAAVGLAGGLLIWLAFDRPLLEGAINFGVTVAFNELQIWTQPMRAARDLAAYEAAHGSIAQSEDQGVALFVTPIPGGLAAGGSF